MQTVVRPEAPIAIHNNLGAIFISLEFSRSRWLITSLAPAGGEKMSICATSGEKAGEDGEGLPVRRHSGGRPRWILDRPRAAE
jgi:transposase